MAVLSKVTARPGDLRWVIYCKWPGHKDGCQLTFVLEDIKSIGYDKNGNWFYIPKFVGLEVERIQWFQVGGDPEELAIMTTMQEVSLRKFPEKCRAFWEQRVKPENDGEVLEINLTPAEWKEIRLDEHWQACLERIRPDQATRDHYRQLFQLVKERRSWLAVTADEQDSLPGAPNPQVHAGPDRCVSDSETRGSGSKRRRMLDR